MNSYTSANADEWAQYPWNQVLRLTGQADASLSSIRMPEAMEADYMGYPSLEDIVQSLSKEPLSTSEPDGERLHYDCVKRRFYTRVLKDGKLIEDPCVNAEGVKYDAPDSTSQETINNRRVFSLIKKIISLHTTTLTGDESTALEIIDTQNTVLYSSKVSRLDVVPVAVTTWLTIILS